MDKSRYPNDWPTIAREIKEAANWQCQSCGKQCRRPGEFYLGWQYQLTVAHITQDYNAPEIQVAAFCTECHLKWDAPFVWVARRRVQAHRRKLAGQLELFF